MYVHNFLYDIYNCMDHINWKQFCDKCNILQWKKFNIIIYIYYVTNIALLCNKYLLCNFSFILILF